MISESPGKVEPSVILSSSEGTTYIVKIELLNSEHQHTNLIINVSFVSFYDSQLSPNGVWISHWSAN